MASTTKPLTVFQLLERRDDWRTKRLTLEPRTHTPEDKKSLLRLASALKKIRLPKQSGRKRKEIQTVSLLKAIAVKSTSRPSQKSISWFATGLRKRTEYQNVSKRTLERRIEKAFDLVRAAAGMSPDSKTADVLSFLRAEFDKITD
jgi:hypothetical protein